MSEAETPFDAAPAHRWFAIECNNQAWDLFDKQDRSEDEADQMVHLAHAACYHWKNAGTDLNYHRALVLLSLAHAETADPTAATRFAVRALKIAESISDELSSFDRAFACLARTCAATASNDAAVVTKWREKAVQAASQIAGDDDRKVFDAYFRRLTDSHISSPGSADPS